MSPVVSKDVRKILAKNLQRLLDHERGPTTQSDLKIRSGVAQATIGRMISAEKAGENANAARITNVQAVAEAYGLQTWELLVPDLDPDRRWKLTREAEPSQEEIERARATFQRLPPDQRDKFLNNETPDKNVA